MVRIAICDDNPQELEKTYSYIEEYRKSKVGWDFTVHKFNNGYSLLDYIDINGSYDVYILDIVMPEIDGIELGAQINKKSYNANIILLSILPDFGVESYTIFAKDYILKPCYKEKLFVSLNRILESMQPQKFKYFMIKTGDGVYAAPYHDILFVEYYKHHLICHMTDGTVVESLSLRESCTVLTEELIRMGDFVRISSSYVVNMRYVKRFTSRMFEMINGDILPLSRLYSDAREAYMDYVSNNRITR